MVFESGKRLGVAVLLALAAGCAGRLAEDPVLDHRVMMDTYVTVGIYDQGVDPATARTAIAAAFDEIHRIEGVFSSYIESSVIVHINRSAGGAPVPVPEEVLGLIARSCRYGRQTQGLFDITVLPVIRLYDFSGTLPRAPEEAELAWYRPLVDYRLIEMRGDSVGLQKAGMGLDLGGIAKGYAVDRAIAVLQAAHYHDVMVNAGGNIGLSLEGGVTLPVLIRHPRLPDAFWGEFHAGSGGIATSGDYERAFVRDGRRYHHLIDPRTGRPSSAAVSVTVLAPTGEQADALSTGTFLMGPAAGIAYLESQPGVDGLMIYMAGDSLVSVTTRGFASRYGYAPKTDGQ